MKEQEAFHETKPHGKIEFPYTVYKGDIPRFIHSFPLHWHEEMELIYVTDGSGIVTVRSTRYHVSRGDIVIVPPQTVHAIERNGDSAMRYYNILFSLSVLDNADDICHGKYFAPLYRSEVEPPFYAENGSRLNALLTPYISELTENRRELIQNGELMIKSALFAVMHYVSEFSKPLSAYKSADASNYDKLKKVLSYVREHYGEQISVNTAAELCAYSRSHFMKIFKSMTGQSFTEYLVGFRLDAAAKALMLKQDRIIDIALSCGFDNPSYFTRAFLRKYGVTPSEYRKRYRADAQ